MSQSDLLNSRPGVGLLSLGDDIHHIILAQLLNDSLSSLISLALASKTLNVIATPYIYRNVSIREYRMGSVKAKVADRLFDRLREKGERNVSRHIRRLCIEYVRSVSGLEEILDGTENLRALNWNANVKFPARILDKMRTDWPDVKISVYNHRRHEAAPNNYGIDAELISSPQLDALDYDIDVGSQTREVVHSEWPEITRLLQTSGSCRLLRLHVHNAWHYRDRKDLHGPESIGMTRFALTPGSRLPPLEELSIVVSGSNTDYVYDDLHCSLLRDSMDWSRMRKLDFGDLCPMEFFSKMVGLTANLASLRVFLPMTPQSLDPLMSFIDSLQNLKALDVANFEVYSDTFWPTVRNHRQTLETLIIRPASSNPPIGPTFWTEVAKDFPCINHVGLAVVSFSRGGRNAKLAEEDIRPFREMDLEVLDLFIHLSYEASPFSDVYVGDRHGMAPPPDLDIWSSKRAAVAIVDAISGGKKRPLQRLNLDFTRSAYDDGYSRQTVEARIHLKRRNVVASGTEEQYSVVGERCLRWTSLGYCLCPLYT